MCIGLGWAYAVSTPSVGTGPPLPFRERCYGQRSSAGGTLLPGATRLRVGRWLSDAGVWFPHLRLPVGAERTPRIDACRVGAFARSADAECGCRPRGRRERPIPTPKGPCRKRKGDDGRNSPLGGGALSPALSSRSWAPGQGRGYRSKTSPGVYASGKGGVSGGVTGGRGGTGGCSCRRAPPNHPDRCSSHPDESSS